MLLKTNYSCKNPIDFQMHNAQGQIQWYLVPADCCVMRAEHWFTNTTLTKWCADARATRKSILKMCSSTILTRQSKRPSDKKIQIVRHPVICFIRTRIIQCVVRHIIINVIFKASWLDNTVCGWFNWLLVESRERVKEGDSRREDQEASVSAEH